jgi:hypothetical protein
MYRILQLIKTYQIAISLLTWQLFFLNQLSYLKNLHLCLKFVF